MGRSDVREWSKGKMWAGCQKEFFSEMDGVRMLPQGKGRNG